MRPSLGPCLFFISGSRIDLTFKLFTTSVRYERQFWGKHLDQNLLSTETSQTQEDFVNDLREVMTLLGLSQKEVAEALGVRSNHINLFFRAKSDIHSAKLLMILDLLGIDVRKLVKKRIGQLSGKKSSEVNVLALRMRHLNPSSRNSLLRLVDQLTQ